jgi:hypothetical protein
LVVSEKVPLRRGLGDGAECLRFAHADVWSASDTAEVDQNAVVAGRHRLVVVRQSRFHYARRVLSVLAKQAPKTSTSTTIVAVIVVVALFALFIYAVNKRR